MANILVNPGTTTAVATIDIGGGVESPRINLISATGGTLYGSAGSPAAGTTVLAVQGVSLGFPQPISVSQIGTTAISAGSGAMDGGTQRVALATNSPGVTGLGQTTMAASLPVAIASDQTPLQTKALHSTGVNGFLATPFTLISGAELTSLVNGSTATSAASGSSGKFSQTNFASARQGLIYFTNSTASFTPTAGGNIAGWFLHSPDGGTLFEKTFASTALARPPDFVIPLTPAATSSGDLFFATGTPLLPWDTVKVYVQNNTGVTLSASAHTISVAPVTDQS